MTINPREIIARRVAQELHDGDLVNLGIGQPTAVVEYIPEDVTIWLHSENGFIGLGPAPDENAIDPDLTNAGGQPVTLSVDTWLYGKPTGKKMTLLLLGVENGFISCLEQREAKSGDRVLAFLTDKWYGLEPLYFSPWPTQNLNSFGFDKTKAKAPEKADEAFTWSHIILDDKTAEEEAVRAAKGYIEFFGRNGTRDRDKYVDFLCSLLNSPVGRIRADTESDLLLFFERELCAPDMLDKLLVDERVRTEVKDYLRVRLRGEKAEEVQ